MLNGTDDGLAGEMRVGSMHTIVQFLMDECGMGPGSTFLDIGSGLGKPVLHAALHAQVQHALGIEVAHATWALAMSTLLRARDRSHLPTAPTIHYTHASVSSLSNLNPCTHVYMFDIGFTPEIYAHIATLISNAPWLHWDASQACAVVVVHHGSYMKQKSSYSKQPINQRAGNSARAHTCEPRGHPLHVGALCTSTPTPLLCLDAC